MQHIYIHVHVLSDFLSDNFVKYGFIHFKFLENKRNVTLLLHVNVFQQSTLLVIVKYLHQPEDC